MMMSSFELSRRKFMKTTLSAAAAMSVAGPALGVLGANDRIRVGFIGSGGRAKSHILRFKPHPKLEDYHKDAEIVALCDPDPAQMDKAAAEVAGKAPKRVKEFRELLDMKDIDAVFVVTPCHWHAIPAIQAMQAGKDVYTEKPIGHTIHEGRVIADTAKKTGRVVQIGTQQRSAPHWINAVKRIRDGELGQITTVNVWNVWTMEEMGGQLGNPPDSDPPPGVDYNLWLGPAPEHKFNTARFHQNFYYFFEYSSGMMGAWGVHLFDVVQWALGYDTLKSVAASGGIYVFKDARNTPDTAQAVFDYDKFVMSYQLRHANGWQPFGQLQFGDLDHGIEFVGTDGVMHCNRQGFYMYHEADRKTRKPYYSERMQGDDTLKHHRNFLDCIRSRKPTNGLPENGHTSAIPGYLATISYRVGRSVKWDVKNETIPGDAEAAKLLTKEYRSPWHL
jgi:predicted dehydrogenase